MFATLISLALALHQPSHPCPLRSPNAASAPVSPTPPVPPVPPATSVASALPHLQGPWPHDTGEVTVDANRSVDEAVTSIAENAHWNLVLNTGSEGEADIASGQAHVAPQAALASALSTTPLVAVKAGDVVVVYDPEGSALRDPLAGSAIAGGALVDARADEDIDAAVTRIAAVAGWSVVANTAEAGDALVRLRLTGVPAEDALRAVLTGTPLAAHQTGGVVTVAAVEGLARTPTLTGFGAPGGKVVTLVGKKRIDAALERIAQTAGWSAQLDTEDAGDDLLVLDLKNVPVEQALAAVLAGTPLSARLDGNRVTVSTGDCTQAGCAAKSDDELEAQLGTLDTEVLEGFDHPLDEQFSGEFNDTPIDEALRKVADSASLSLVLPRSLHGSVTAHFHDAEVEDVLRAILSQNGLVAVKRGTVVTVDRRLRSGVSMRVNLDQLMKRTSREVQRAMDRQSDRAQRDADRAEADANRAEADVSRAEADAPSHAGDQAATGDITLGAGEKARDLVALHGNAKLGPGSHAREVTAVFGSVEIGPGAIVEREVTAIGGDVHVAPGGRVGDAATAIGGKVIIDPGASVKERSSIKFPGLSSLSHVAETAVQPSFSPLLALGSMLAQFALYFALGLILLVFWPRRLERVTAALRLTPTRSTAIGMLGVLAVPVLTLLLVVTVVGIPLVLVEGFGLLVGEVLGLSALALLIGQRLPVDVGRGASVVNLALGTAVLVVVTHLPVIGWLIEACAVVVVLGAVLSTRFGHTDGASTDAPLTP